MSRKKKIPFKSSVAIYKRLLRYVFPYWRILLVAILGNVFYAASDSSMTYLLKPILDKGFVEQQMSFLKWLPILLFVIFFARALTNFVANYCMSLVSRNMVRDLRQVLFAHYLRLPAYYYDSNSSGSMLSTIIYNVSQVAVAGTDALSMFIQSVFLTLGLLIVMFIISWKFSLLYLVAAPIIAFIIKYASSRIRQLSSKVQFAMGDVTHVAEESIEGYRVVKAFGGTPYEKSKFNNATETNRRREMKVVLTKSLSISAVQIIGGCVLILTIYLATAAGPLKLSAGSFVALVSAMLAILKPMKTLTNINAIIQRGLAGAESIFNILDIEAERDTGNKKLQRAKGEISYHDVSFTYPNSQDKKVLHHINALIKPGQSVALVGRSGSGKSTFVSLLLRFYDVTNGEIRIDGIPAHDLKLSSLRDQFAIVSQNVTLFNDTIEKNIAYGKFGGASEAEVIHAAEVSHAMEFIRELPDGLKTVIGDNGVLLSGGQRQRLAIARAVLKDAPILIMDEATASLDTESERYIQEAMDVLTKNRTTIVIAHRLSTIENADLIMVMDHGEIVEKGTHAELIQLDGQYAKLHNMQFKDPLVTDSNEAQTSIN